MRPAFLTAARHLQRGRDAAVEGFDQEAVREYNHALQLLRSLPPERTRDVLLAHTHLAYYQTLAPASRRGDAHQVAQEHLHLGISYARSTRDPLARAIAEECLSGLDVVL
ncbi:hypothetical protein [Deinococcus maricopensis]|uniref:Uncharacterized protein n=1 Tax=Deinococcus maricopensis (strain DSM 21211 / LMG 22137 / NRRL B-23946 / LB-34) TaxID=709986 RepID=E8U697_DEIML|nr:hypothetical protein [Deinococcus maricopensis]ADV66586.1 hypothetical protein Deima_0932 [Deinococcus maricopensis DSM 21211]